MENKIDLTQVLNKDQSYVSHKVQSNKMIILYKNRKDQETGYLIYDMSKKKVVKTISSPVNSYVFETYSYQNNLLVCTNSLKPNRLYINEILNNDWENVLIPKTIKPIGDIVLFPEGWVFYTQSMYGIYVFNIKEESYYNIEGNHAQHSEYFLLGFPIKGDNIVTGKFNNDNSNELSIFCFKKDSIVWRESIPIIPHEKNSSFENFSKPVSILNGFNHFCLSTNKLFLIFDKEDGQIVYTQKVHKNPRIIGELNQDNYLCSFESEIGNNSLMIISVKGVSDIIYESQNKQIVYLNESEILVFENNKITSLSKNKILSSKSIKSDLSDLKVDLDVFTGSRYLIFRRKTIYW